MGCHVIFDRLQAGVHLLPVSQGGFPFLQEEAVLAYHQVAGFLEGRNIFRQERIGQGRPRLGADTKLGRYFLEGRFVEDKAGLI